MAASLHSPRLRRLALWLGGIFVAFSLLGFFLAPVILRQQLVKQGSAALHRPVTVDQVRVNPWTCSVTIRGLAVAARDGAEFAGWDELHVNFSPLSSLAHLAWSFDEISLVHPRARLSREADGTLNIADLIPPPAPPAAGLQPAGAVAALVIARFALERGEFTYADKARSVPFATTFGPTTFELVDFTTRPNRSGTYSFVAATEAGEKFAWEGKLTFQPLVSSGHLEITDLALPKYSAFHRDLHHLDLLSGRLGVVLDYAVDLSGAEPVARVHDGRITLADLQLAARGTTTPLAKIPLVEVTGLAADSAKMEAAVAKILVRGADLSATRRADASIDWLALLHPAVPATAAAPVAASTSSSTSTSTTSGGAGGALPFTATLGSLEVESAALHLHDLTTPRPVALTIDELAFKLTGASTRLDQPVALATSLRWGGTGRIAVEGRVTPQPLAADLQVDVADIALRPLDPYLAPFVNVLLTGGAARAKGHLTFALTAEGAPDLHWEGDAGLSALATVDGEFSEPLVGFADLALNKITATTQPLAVSIEEIALQDPYSRAIRFPDNQINLTAILKTPAPGTEPETGATAAPAPAAPSAQASILAPQITIARVTISGGNFSFTDRSATPAFTTALADFGGTIAGLSSAELARADVDLTGRIGVAQLKIGGKINPLSGDAFTDLKVTLAGMELPPFTPYSGRYAGYTIDKGKLSLDLAYHLSARELVAENKVALDQFYLGQPVESPDAVKLPLKLALGILRDRDGRIPIDLPIRGNLDDPDFKYGKVVWHALGNLLVKAATSPFSVLGGLFGNGHDLSAVDFASGSAEFSEEALARLDGLAKALAERPALRLEISSLPQPELDLDGLRAARLDALLRTRKIRELAATSDAAIDPATIQLTPEETARYLAELATERAAQLTTTTGEPPAAQPVAAPAAPASRKSGNLLVRTYRRIFTHPGATATTAATGSASQPQLSTSTSLPPAAPTAEELRIQLLPTIEITSEEFAALATARAERIQEYLTTKAAIDSARVFFATGVPPAAAATATPRVVFSLQ